MKIISVDTKSSYANFRNWVFVRVKTDCGIHGVGEATMEFQTNAVMGMLRDISPLVIGKNPLNIPELLYKTRRYAYYSDNPVLQSALAGIETALWDINGKFSGLPVWQLLGGRFRDKIAVYGNGWRGTAQTPEEFALAAAEAVREGYTAIKWDPFGCADITPSARELCEAEEQVAAVRSAVGKNVQLLIEAHGRFSTSGALQAIRMLEPYDPYYIEEPVQSGNIAGLAELRRKARIRIAAGERIYSLNKFKDLFIAGGVDIVQPDLIHVGGILSLRKIAALAESFGVSVAPHNCNGPVCTAATLHADAGIDNLDLQEMFLTDAPWRREISNESVHISSGSVLLPDTRGLGVDIDFNALEEHPPQHIPDFMFSSEYYMDKGIRRASQT